ncbi:MAG: ATP-binding protein, partial [Synechococcaceae bacterium WB9_4xB_025]|nr:ATP-binding protein [Synechococcaceae bacterium WB9_4xB_025]
MHAEIPVVLNRWLACHIAVAKASVSSCTASRDASCLLMGSSIAIGELKQHVEQSCEALGVAPETLSKTLPIVDELLANISSHASESINQALEITIQLHCKPSHLQLTISDNGAPVNPLQADALQEPAAG